MLQNDRGQPRTRDGRPSESVSTVTPALRAAASARISPPWVAPSAALFHSPWLIAADAACSFANLACSSALPSVPAYDTGASLGLRLASLTGLAGAPSSSAVSGPPPATDVGGSPSLQLPPPSATAASTVLFATSSIAHASTWNAAGRYIALSAGVAWTSRASAAKCGRGVRQAAQTSTRVEFRHVHSHSILESASPPGLMPTKAKETHRWSA
jgi:hypothetical protein